MSSYLLLADCTSPHRSVRESASYAGDGLQLSQAKDIVKVREGVLDLSAGEGEEAAALTVTIVQNLQIGIDCYKAKVEAIRQKLREAEAWTHRARDIMTHESITVEQFETLLKEAQEVGVENEDLAKKIRAELGRCRAWMNKADDALKGREKPKASLVKKLLAEGEKIKVTLLLSTLFPSPYFELLSALETRGDQLISRLVRR